MRAGNSTTGGKIEPYNVACWNERRHRDPGHVRLVARDDEHRHLGQVLDEPLGRRHEFADVGARPEEVADHLATGSQEIGLAVPRRANLGAEFAIADDEPAPRLLIRAIGGLERDPQAVAYLGRVDGRASRSSDLRAERVAVRSCSTSMALTGP